MSTRRIVVSLSPVQLDVVLRAVCAIESEVEPSNETTWTRSRVAALSTAREVLDAALAGGPAQPTPTDTEENDHG